MVIFKIERNMKKLFYVFTFLGAVVFAQMQTSCTRIHDEAYHATNLFKAIANNDPHAFNWITVEEVDQLNGTDKEALARIRAFASDIDKNVPPLLAEWRKLGEKVGINWNDIKVDTVYITEWGDSNYEVLGVPAREGYIIAQSNEKKFKIRYEQAIQLTGWRTIALTNFLPLDENGKVISTVTLKQDGTFEEFYRSLAECFNKEAQNEIDKIFLTNDKGERVFQIAENEKDAWEENWNGFTYERLRKHFVQCIEDKDCVADEMNYAMLVEYGMIDRFGLDRDEIFDKAQLWKVVLNLEKYANNPDIPDKAMDFLDGKFMKYKGKWYYIGDFDSGYEH